MLPSFLEEFHTDGQGTIMINDDESVLRMTMELIKEDAEIDYECMSNQLDESDEKLSLLESMLTGKEDDQIKCLAGLQALSSKIQIETIDRLLRAEL